MDPMGMIRLQETIIFVDKRWFLSISQPNILNLLTIEI